MRQNADVCRFVTMLYPFAAGQARGSSVKLGGDQITVTAPGKLDDVMVKDNSISVHRRQQGEVSKLVETAIN